MSEKEIVENWLNMKKQQPVQLATQEAYWQHYRIQAAIAAMQGMLAGDTMPYDKALTISAVELADALVEELRRTRWARLTGQPTKPRSQRQCCR